MCYVWTHTHTPCQFLPPCQPWLPPTWNAQNTASQILLILRTLETFLWLPPSTTASLSSESYQTHSWDIPWLVAKFLYHGLLGPSSTWPCMPQWPHCLLLFPSLCSVCFSHVGLLSLHMLPPVGAPEPCTCYPWFTNLGMIKNLSLQILKSNFTNSLPDCPF